jgi:hypothetical protein
VLHKLLAEADFGFVSSDAWRKFAKLHQALLTNVFGIQNKLRITTLGVSFWEKVSKRRIQIRPGCVVPLSDLMALVSQRASVSLRVVCRSIHPVFLPRVGCTALPPQGLHGHQG